MKKGSRLALTAVVAAGIGYVAGILTAPKSGKETRKDIHGKAVQTKEEIGKKLDELSTELGNTITKGKAKVKHLESGARSELEKAVSNAVIAKDKAKDVLGAFKSGEAEDKDLQNAVKDVHKAIDNLKKYLEKNV